MVPKQALINVLDGYEDAVHAEYGDSALLVTEVPLGPRGAPFTRFGGVPFQWLTYAATLLMLGAMVTSRRRTV